MSKRTRLFLLISAGVLATGLGTGLLASYMGVGLQSLTQMGSDSPAELAYLPQDSALVAFANVRDVMDSELRRKLLPLRPDDTNASDDFEAKTGISIERDVDVVVASFAHTGENERPLLVARGRFDEPRIEGLVRDQNGTVEDYKGVKLMTVADNDQTLAIAFPEASLLVAGTVDAVRRAIDTKQGAAPDITNNAEVMNLVRDIDDANAWAVGRFDAMAQRGRLPSELAGQLPPINWFAASGRINGGVQGVLQAEANSDQAAADLRQVVQGFMALARLNTRQSAELTALLNSLQLGGDGRTVSVTFAVPADMVEAFVALHQRRQQDDPNPDPPEQPNPPVF